MWERRSLLAIIVSGTFLLPSSVSALEILETRAGTEGNGVYWLRATGIIDARPLAVRHVLSRLCEYRDQIAYWASCSTFKVEGNRAWSYSLIRPPVIDPRDYSLLSVIERDLEPDGTGEYLSRWSLTPDEGPRPRPGVVRLRTDVGSTLLTPANDGKRTRVVYNIQISPGGYIPSGAAAFVASKTWPEGFRTVERLARMEDRRGTVVLPVPGQPWAGLTGAASLAVRTVAQAP